MPYYIVTRESTAFQSIGVNADNPEEARKKAAEAKRGWETDDIEPCNCPMLWEIEDEDGNTLD